MSHSKLNSTNHELSNKRTSAGVRFADVPEDCCYLVEWIEGCHSFDAQLPCLSELPIPCLLYTSTSPRDVEESRMPSSA